MLRKKLKLSENDVPDTVEANVIGDFENPNVSEANKSSCESCTNPQQYSIALELQYWEKIWKLEQNLIKDLLQIDFKSDKNIAAIYNPLDYAADVHKNFMQKYLKKSPTVLFLGMNPGLFGMCQVAVSG